MENDFYKTLGVQRDVDDAALKKAYRKLAREHHPDANPGQDAEEQFKRIGEAYAVLSDPDKRARYDRYGHIGLQEGFDAAAWERHQARRSAGGPAGFSYEGFDPSMFEGFDLSDLFGGGAAAHGAGFHVGGNPFGGGRGRDINLGLAADFEQAAKGFQTRFTYARPERCNRCAGSGAEGGRRCSSCGGRGTVDTRKTLTVKVPPGAETGDVIRLRGKGAEGRGGQGAGDLVLRLEVKPHPSLAREGLDLVTEARISPLAAMLGGTVDVDGLGGTFVARFPAGVKSGTRLRITGKGVQRGERTGNLLAEIVIDGGLSPLDEEGRRLALALQEHLESTRSKDTKEEA
ncbi:MAG: J domain-containing protein [Deltaproteobacteria bacterium]|nr:MAG: J domain-containing protein [Deltaproteobacteria bacterium]